MKPNEVLPISAALRAVGAPIAYYPVFAHCMGGVKSAIFLSQFIYWYGKQADQNGWIYKTQAELESETGLTRTEQENARNILKQLFILEESRRGQPAKLYYRFNWDKIDEIVSNYASTLQNGFAPAKAVPEAEQKHEPLTYRCKVAFDTAYGKEGVKSKLFYTTAFVWGKENSKEWAAMKKVAALVRSMIVTQRAIKNNATPVTDDDIVNALTVILDNMGDYHRERNFTPTNISSNFNKIIQDITHDKRNSPKNSGATNRDPRETASTFV